jgi:hypothetical protein
VRSPRRIAQLLVALAAFARQGRGRQGLGRRSCERIAILAPPWPPRTRRWTIYWPREIVVAVLRRVRVRGVLARARRRRAGHLLRARSVNPAQGNDRARGLLRLTYGDSLKPRVLAQVVLAVAATANAGALVNRLRRARGSPRRRARGGPSPSGNLPQPCLMWCARISQWWIRRRPRPSSQTVQALLRS